MISGQTLKSEHSNAREPPQIVRERPSEQTNPWRHSNPQSPDSESDALSKRPHGQLLGQTDSKCNSKDYHFYGRSHQTNSSSIWARLERHSPVYLRNMTETVTNQQCFRGRHWEMSYQKWLGWDAVKTQARRYSKSQKCGFKVRHLIYWAMWWATGSCPSPKASQNI